MLVYDAEWALILAALRYQSLDWEQRSKQETDPVKKVTAAQFAVACGKLSDRLDKNLPASVRRAIYNRQ